jgi:hypothetical protein
MRSIDEVLRRDCAGKLWWPRAPLIVWFGFTIRGHLEDPWYRSLWDGLNLGVHELGHILFSPGGEWWGVAGGSLAQILVPMVAALLFYRQRDWFAIAVAAFWLGTSLVNVAIYMADARDLLLPLVSMGGGDVIHDWNYLFWEAGVLHRDKAIGAVVRKAGIITMLAGMGSGAWILLVMARAGDGDAGPNETGPDPEMGSDPVRESRLE